MRRLLRNALTIQIALICIIIGSIATAEENDSGTLEKRLSEKTAAIKALEQEIEGYQKQLEEIGAQKNTLNNKIKELDITRKKLQADVNLTQNKITKANLRLEELTENINDKDQTIFMAKQSLKEAIKMISENETRDLSEIILSAGSINQYVDTISELSYYGNSIKTNIDKLNTLKSSLEADRKDTINIKAELINLRDDLEGRRKVVDYNKSATSKLLANTKNSETAYKKILDEKTALRDAFERELLEIESQLKLLTDPSKIPPPEKGLLAWPLTKIRITQLFGRTSFSEANSYVYNGQGHNGVDFGIPTGTAVLSSASGIVKGTGDTDAVCPGASYGKWVLIEHPFGLSTLYAHLSVIQVNEGTDVSAGSVIGYSGDTGYSTGPHLHYTVYATQGVKITERKSRVCKGSYRMPLADLRAYLNPLSYLPEK